MILKLTVLLILAAALDFALRRASAALRHLVWTLALASSLILPVAGLYAPRLAGPAFVIQTSGAVANLAEPERFPWILAVYGLGVAFLLARLALDILAANRLVKRARPSSLPGVLVSTHSNVPFAWGVVVVPASFETSDAVLAHERAHIARCDAWTSVLARVACAVYWFHPLVWWAASRMRLEADRACDDAVLLHGAPGTGYAEDLVRIARALHPAPLAPGAVLPSQLETRIRHILAGAIDRSKLGRASCCAAALVCLAIVVPLSAITERPFDKVYRVGNGVLGPAVIHKEDPQYSERARRSKLAGTVLLSIVVGSDGAARDIHVVGSLNPDLDANAVSAIRRWKFRPATKDGLPVNVRATIEVNFRLL